jgi:hypothetical protein
VCVCVEGVGWGGVGWGGEGCHFPYPHQAVIVAEGHWVLEGMRVFVPM